MESIFHWPARALWSAPGRHKKHTLRRKGKRHFTTARLQIKTGSLHAGWIAKNSEKTRSARAYTPGTRALRHPTATRSYRDTNNVRGVMLERPTELLVGTQSLLIDRPRSRLPTQNPVSKYVLYNIAPKNTCTDNYEALYCKVRTLRLDFARDLLCLPVPVY